MQIELHEIKTQMPLAIAKKDDFSKPENLRLRLFNI